MATTEKMTWYYAVNTFAAVPGDTVGSIISRHKTAAAAWRKCRAVQPRERGSYLPVGVVRSDEPQLHDIYVRGRWEWVDDER